MKRPILLALALLVAVALAETPAGAGEPYAKHLDAKAGPVVLVKLVLKMGEREQSVDQTGTVVDPSGVVMLPNLGTMRGGAAITPTSIRVVFPGDEKEYDAILGAFDSKLGLAFVRIKDLAGKTITSVNPAESVEVKIGDELFAVTRTDEGFDFAPYYGTLRVVGQVTKPRTMWLVSGFQPLAHPAYDADGKVAGVVIRQQGISEGFSGSRICLLPMSAAQAVIQQGIKASAKALEDAKAKEAAAKEGAGMEGETPKEPAMEGGAGMGDAPGMDAPGGMDDGK